MVRAYQAGAKPRRNPTPALVAVRIVVDTLNVPNDYVFTKLPCAPFGDACFEDWLPFLTKAHDLRCGKHPTPPASKG